MDLEKGTGVLWWKERTGLMSIEGKSTYFSRRLLRNTGYYIFGRYPISVNEL